MNKQACEKQQERRNRGDGLEVVVMGRENRH
jgi:hypothetical protein